MNLQRENAVTVQLGKKGLTPALVEEIMKNLDQDRLVKVKFLRNAMENTDRDAYAGSVLAEVEKRVSVGHKLVGRTLFLKKINA
jgi:RNA-binding protein YhbY